MGASTKPQRAEKPAADAQIESVDVEAATPGAVEQLTIASREALKAGQHAEHAALESALFALYTARMRLAAIDLDGPVGAVKALL